MKDKIKNHLVKNKYECFYLIIYGVILIYETIGTTMFEFAWPEKMGYFFFVAISGYTMIKMIGSVSGYNHFYGLKEVLYSFFMIMVFIIPAVFTTEYSFLFEIVFLIIGARKIKFENILKIYLVVVSVILITAMICGWFGIIENLVYEDWRRGNRYSFGCVYPTDFAAHIFYLVLAYVGCYYKKMKSWWGLVVMGLSVGLYKLCYAYTSTLTLFLFGLCILIYSTCKGKVKQLTVPRVSSILPAMTALIFPALMTIYNGSEELWYRLDLKLGYRLLYTSWAIRDYGLSLFGKTVNEIGNGRTTVYNNDYYFIDDSYMRIMIEYGMVVFVTILIMLTLISYKMLTHKQIILFLILEIICIHSIMEHHLMELAYNPFILYLYAENSELEVREKTL